MSKHIKMVLNRFAERALRLGKDSAETYEHLFASEARYGEALQRIHDAAIEIYYIAKDGAEE